MNITALRVPGLKRCGREKRKQRGSNQARVYSPDKLNNEQTAAVPKRQRRGRVRSLYNVVQGSLNGACVPGDESRTRDVRDNHGCNLDETNDATDVLNYAHRARPDGAAPASTPGAHRALLDDVDPSPAAILGARRGRHDDAAPASTLGAHRGPHDGAASSSTLGAHGGACDGAAPASTSTAHPPARRPEIAVPVIRAEHDVVASASDCVVCYKPCVGAPLLRCGHNCCAECIDKSLRMCTGLYKYCCGICRRPFRANVTDVTDAIIAGELDSKPINFEDKAHLKKVLARLGSVKMPAASFQTYVDERVGNKGSRLETIVWGVAGLTYYRARRFAAAVRVFEKTFPLRLGGASPGLVDALQTAVDLRSVNVTDRTGDEAQERPWSHTISDQLRCDLPRTEDWEFGFFCRLLCAKACLGRARSTGRVMYDRAHAHICSGTFRAVWCAFVCTCVSACEIRKSRARALSCLSGQHRPNAEDTDRMHACVCVCVCVCMKVCLCTGFRCKGGRILRHG